MRLQSLMELLQQFVDIFMRLDLHLAEWAAQLGPYIYVLLFLVIFCETGLVVTPFLPGDSLLFATGALVALSQNGAGYPLSFSGMVLLLIAAAILGDNLNYWIGARLGAKLLLYSEKGSRFIRRDHIEKTRQFYARYGGKTIVFARFIPIVRTFAPFVAGLGSMSFRHFLIYNIFGGVVWVAGFISAGYWFGNIPTVKRNFQWVILTIIVLSVLPAVIEYIRMRSHRNAAPQA
ncbi:MAG: DedA family protein [Bdellovibrionales bacterium]|nr:DedA family protein [Bdellovibrionales bacterium]